MGLWHSFTLPAPEKERQPACNPGGIILVSVQAEPLNTTITIKAVETRKEYDAFLHFPYRLNRLDRCWVPPLRISQKQLLTENHPFWQRNPHEFFLAWQNGECVGRIAAIINKEHNVYHHVNEGSFGFLEAKNEAVAFRQLLKAAENFCAQNGCANITGPLNPSLHYELGVLTTGFNSPPYFMLTHNASYYDARIKEAGYQKQKDFYSYLLDGTRYVPTQKMQRVSAFLKERYKITIRQAEQKAFEKEMAIFILSTPMLLTAIGGLHRWPKMNFT